MGPCAIAIRQMMYQPVGHFVGHHLDQESTAVLVEENRVESQATTTEMGLPGALATQVEPDGRARQGAMHLATQPPGGLYPLAQHALAGSAIERVEPFGIGFGQRGMDHGVLEWRHAKAA